MRANLKKVIADKSADDNFTVLSSIINGNVGVDNLSVIFLEGTTAGIADTVGRVLHNLQPQPTVALPVIGDVYIREITGTYIDVRSTKVSQPFKLMLLMGKSIKE